MKNKNITKIIIVLVCLIAGFIIISIPSWRLDFIRQNFKKELTHIDESNFNGCSYVKSVEIEEHFSTYRNWKKFQNDEIFVYINMDFSSLDDINNQNQAKERLKSVVKAKWKLNEIIQEIEKKTGYDKIDEQTITYKFTTFGVYFNTDVIFDSDEFEITLYNKVYYESPKDNERMDAIGYEFSQNRENGEVTSFNRKEKTYSNPESSKNKSKTYNYKSPYSNTKPFHDPDDYDNPDDYADDAWGTDFDSWDEAEDYWMDW